jgi:hypothetical protein
VKSGGAAAIERTMAGRELEPDSTWAWADLDQVRADHGGAPLPFIMINDLGVTFGGANLFNANAKAMNLKAWAATPTLLVTL